MKHITKLCIILLTFILGCKKEDYTLKPSPYNKGEYVRLDGVDPSKSFTPHCGTPKMLFKITNVYLIGDYMVWWYDLESDDGCILIHVPNTNLKK